MNHARIPMLVKENTPAGRRNVARTGKDGAQIDSHEYRRTLDPLHAFSANYVIIIIIIIIIILRMIRKSF
jgi:hypothetical protein